MFDPTRTELLVIDFQEKLFGSMPEGDGEGGRDRALKVVDNLLFAATELDLPVTLTEQYRKGLGPTLPSLKLPRQAFRFEKTAFSAVREHGFPEKHRAEILIVGMEAHICVALTTIDLLARGATVFIVADGCLSRRAEDRNRGLDLCAHAGARVVSSETALFAMMERPGTPLFKEISRRIR